VAGAHGHRQRIDLGSGHELHRLVRVGQKLVVGEHAFRAVAVLGLALAALQIQYGFTSVMMDGSLKADGKTPADYNYNVEITRNVTKIRSRRGRR
jgi:fructose/tagatose bisphosphate aldolase